MCRVFEMENSFVNSTLFCSVSAMPESSAWQDICRWEFCPEHEDDDDDDDDIDQGRIGGDLFSLLITSASFLMSVFPNDIQRNPLYGSIRLLVQFLLDKTAERLSGFFCNGGASIMKPLLQHYVRQ